MPNWPSNRAAQRLHVTSAAPADTGEPLSSVAVEARVPDVIRLDDAIAGPLACNYCSTRYAAEQLSCPRCGAHALGR